MSLLLDDVLFFDLFCSIIWCLCWSWRNILFIAATKIETMKYVFTMMSVIKYVVDVLYLVLMIGYIIFCYVLIVIV